MSVAVHRPAWQTDELQEEWIDLEPEGDDADDDLTYGTQSISLTAPLSTHIHTHSGIEGSATPSQTGTARAVGTFVLHEDAPNASMPFLPKTPGRNNKNGIKDFFTPLPLERMFDPPTPPVASLSKTSSSTAKSLSPPQSAILKAGEDTEEVAEDEDEILETDMPNMRSFNGRRPSIACQFTFAVPKGLSPNFPQAQSTPHPPANHGLSAPPTDSRLRLFQFQYDTYTREHLSAMVDSIAVNTPSGSGTTATPPSFQQQLSRVTERTSDTSHLRSAKRLKLSPASDFYGEGAGAGAVIKRPPLTGKDYVGESRSLMEKIKQARDFSTLSSVASAKSSPSTESKTDVENPLNPEQTGSKPDSARRTSAYLAVPDNNKGGSSTPSSVTSKSNSYSSYRYRQNAAALMEQIKNDMKGSKRLFSADTDTSVGTFDDQNESYNCSAVSTTPAPRPRNSAERENRSPSSQARGHRRTSSSRSHGSRTNQSPSRVFNRSTHDEVSHRLSRLSLANVPTNASNPPEAEPRQGRPPSSLAPPSYPSASVRANGNEDLNRFVSSSTASGTTLTAGSAPSFTKHAGPPHLRTIAPTDLPPMPERLGDMLFDKVMMKWVKNTAHATGDPDKSGISQDDLSDDPFGDIESLRDDSGGQETRLDEERNALEVAEDHDAPNASVAEMDEIEERSEAEDHEEFELTSFSTDASMHVVDIMTGVDSTGYNDGDETTDSEDDELDGTVTAQPVPVVDYESGDEDLSMRSPPPVPGVSIQTAPEHPPHEPITQLSTPNRHNRQTLSTTPILRSALKSGSATPTSALKGSRGRHQTPNQSGIHRRSVSFSDGKLDGPIQDLSGSTDTDSSTSQAIGVTPNITLPSARSKRIADMMEALANSDFDEEDSPSKTSSSGRPDELRPLAERMQGSTSIQSGSPREGSRRVFSRSQTHRPSPRRAKSSERANATFLTECSFGVAHDRLVEVITDVQPFEPFWDQLGSIDLSGKKLESVARLKEFLPRLDSLNLNYNELAWLSGVPATVRTLSVASNSLTGLTSYSHLLNIENLDISHNEVDSLRQLECLRHLRELKADGNKITSVDGLQRMDGLVKLSLQGNTIQSLDLAQYRWTRLEMLNVSHNRLDSVRGLASLQALIAVNLDNNSLRKVDFGSGMPRLRILRLSSNKLTELTVSALPNLRTLYADNNSLTNLTKVDRLTKLENLSLRNQSGRVFNLLTRDVRDVKRLYLSGRFSLLMPLWNFSVFRCIFYSSVGRQG
ncbi:protein phosphatase regulatory subunit, variant 3 [Coprinopsis cinerea AmutBmut pab1-1]|nr:protein phosphatase regulatory subunit, variant 3 [Coprinopsis cinerea AmutBmut pab1-1]